MKTNQSGNGVTVANRFKIARLLMKNIWDDYKIKTIKASEMMQVWNYKAEGLNLDQAKAEIMKAINHRQQVAKVKPRPAFKKSAGAYLKLQEGKRRSIESFIAQAEKLHPAQNAYQYDYGNYKGQQRNFLLTNTPPYPVTIGVTWSEYHDWNYYAKRYKHPKSTYSDRAVEFKTIGKLGKVETIYLHALTSFSGNFIEKAIAAFYKVQKVTVGKELKPVQLADFFSLTELKAINGYRLFQRNIGPVQWDYAILDTKTGTSYHSFTYESLGTGLRNKINAKADADNQIITKETGFKLGFCETGMRNFCDDNNTDINGSYTRQQLRNIVIQNRDVNYRKYRKELAMIGIRIGK